jgi:hypothetical protein
MKKSQVVGMGCASIALVTGMIAFSIFMWIVGIKRDEITLRERFEKQELNVETTLDNAWRNISSQFKVTEEYKDTVIQLMKEVSLGRQGGSLFRNQTESDNPLGLDPTLFRDLMAAIEAHGNRFTSEQRTLASIHQEWSILYKDPIKGNFLRHVEPIPTPQMIVSARSRQAIDSGIAPDSFL